MLSAEAKLSIIIDDFSNGLNFYLCEWNEINLHSYNEHLKIGNMHYRLNFNLVKTNESFYQSPKELAS